MIYADLYTFTLANGTQDFLTDLDWDIVYGGHTYSAGRMRILGLKMKLAVGLEVDEQDLRIFASPDDTLGGVAFLAGVEQGLLDGAFLARDRIIWLSQTGNFFLDILETPIDKQPVFYGRVSTITKVGRSVCELKVKSPLSLLSMEMPRNYYSPGCNWTLFDTGCTLSKAAYRDGPFHITNIGTNNQVLRVSDAFPHGVNGADGLPYYAQGRLLFIDGPNAGQQLSVANNYVFGGENFFAVKYAWNIDPIIGNTFYAYPGCSKALSTCDLKFGNKINFRGFPFIPPVHTGF